MELIRRERRDDAIIGEEGAGFGGTTGVAWIIDPLDGTTNFVYGYPAHSVAIGIEIDGRRAIGVVRDTARNREYSGIVGVGAWVDGVAIRARNSSELSSALVGTGFLPQSAVREKQGVILQRVLPKVRDIRRSGCPSLDLCAVADGSLDAFYEYGLGRWDIAGGAAIAEAAGATVALLDGGALPSPLVIAGGRDVVRMLHWAQYSHGRECGQRL